MSKYVDHPHGLIIGSDNWFFFRDENDELQSGYKAIVWAKGYNFDQYNGLNVWVRTPAQQIIAKPTTIMEPTFYAGHPDFTNLPQENEVNVAILRQSMVRWLDDNAPGWAVSVPKSNEREPTLFFMKRGHALAFVRMVCDHLKGIRIEK